MADPIAAPWYAWGGDPSVLVGLVYLQVAYLLGVGPLRRRFGLAARFPLGQAITFSAGVLVIYVALQSPLHPLSDRYLFSAHMVQHLLLTLGAAPLLLLGTPSWLLRPALRFSFVLPAGRFLTAPVLAFAIYNGVLLFSHLPLFYDLALRVHDLHVAQHLVYLATALLVWWPIAGPLPEIPRPSHPLQMIYTFAQTLPAFLLGALITFAEQPIYPTYAAAPRVFALTPVDDQRLGGLIMWVLGSIYYLCILGVIFFRWFEEEEQASRRPGGGLAKPAG